MGDVLSSAERIAVLRDVIRVQSRLMKSRKASPAVCARAAGHISRAIKLIESIEAREAAARKASETQAPAPVLDLSGKDAAG